LIIFFDLATGKITEILLWFNLILWLSHESL
jgi:hypothetical protein